MLIYNFDKWNDLNEDRITPISENKFKELLKKYCHSNQEYFLYKKIINPKNHIGIFFKSTKTYENHVDKIQNKFNIEERSYPDRESSLVCYNYIEKEEGTTFVVFPFKSSLFTISYHNEKPETLENCNKGYWTEKIKWLENLNEREMWTESPCLLIEKKLWDKIKKSF